MTSGEDTKTALGLPGAVSRPLVGRFVGKQGVFGAVAVVGRVGESGIELFDKPKRQFPREGLVEIQGVIQAGLLPGEWVEFDAVKNQRPRAHQYKTAHLRRLPRYAVLPELTVAGYRALLTKTGWKGDRRSGLWALGISSGRVLLTELEIGKDGALRIPRNATSDVRWHTYSDELVAKIPLDGGAEAVFLGDIAVAPGSFDWSDEVDYIARVVRSMSVTNDPHVADIISWLELHHEELTDNVLSGAIDRSASESALRSGELAQRLRGDREIMKAYLDAALQDEEVREVVAGWAREGHGDEAERLRRDLQREIAEVREQRLAVLAVEVEEKRLEALAKVEAEASLVAEAHRAEAADRRRNAETAQAERLRAFEEECEHGRETFRQETREYANALDGMRVETEAATRELDQVRAEKAEAGERLAALETEIDRLLAVSDRLGSEDRQPNKMAQAFANGVPYIFHARQLVPAASKGALIQQHALLTNGGKQQMLRLATLMLAGELPLLTGGDAPNLAKVAGAVLTPGRSASIEADPTIISVDDLWSRPGSGALTAMAAAAAAAGEGGATLVTIRGIERSGARFWYPALGEALRGGGLPRGLLVTCLIGDREHEEVEALPLDTHLMEVENAFTDSAYLAGPMLLAPPALQLETLEPDPVSSDLSSANALLTTLGFKPSLDISMRVARIYLEAMALLGDEGEARPLVVEIARKMAERMGLRAL